MKQKLFVLLSTVLMVHAAMAQSFDKVKLDSYFNALGDNNRFMGSVAISENGKVIYSKAVGFADVAKGVKASTETKYRIGSISKTFTATLVMKAVEQKKLQLDQTIDKWFPELLNAKKITVSNLLNHSSGIYDFTHSAAYLVWFTNPQTEAAMMEKIKSGGSEFEPGSKSDYSNSNYVLLTFILEKVNGKSYSDLLSSIITKPLGLKDTYVGSKINTSKKEALSYIQFKDEKWEADKETDMSVPLGAGAVVSTPSDLVKFADALFAGKIVTTASLKQMQNITDEYGFGLFQIPFNDDMGFGHTGGIDGFSSVFASFPASKRSYAICSNGGTFSNNEILIAMLMASNNKDFSIPEFKTIELPEAALDPFLGIYASKQIPLKITISKDGNVLKAQATGQSAFPLEAIGENVFQFTAAGIVLEFEAAKKQMVLKQGGGTFTFEKE